MSKTMTATATVQGVAAPALRDVPSQDTLQVTIPDGLAPGTQFVIIHNGQQVVATVPDSAHAGDMMHVQVPSAQMPVAVTAAVSIPVEAVSAPAQVHAVRAHRTTNTMNQPGVHVIHMSQAPRLNVGSPQLQQDVRYAENVLREASWVSCFALMDMFLVFFSIFTNMGYLALLMLIGPMYGYWGARSLNPGHVSCYLIYLVFVLCIRITSMVASDKGEFAWAVILFICQVYITSVVYKFWKMLRNLDHEAIMNAVELSRQRREQYYARY